MTEDDKLAIVAEVMENGRYRIVHRVYIVNDYGTRKFVQRGLQDEHGLVFTAGHGWTSYPNSKIVRLPNPIVHVDWNEPRSAWEDGTNWRRTDWSWAFGMRPAAKRPPGYNSYPGVFKDIGNITFQYT